MNVQSCPWPVAAVVAVGLTLSGCAVGASASGDTSSSVDRAKDRAKDRKHAKAAAKKRKARAAARQEKAAAPKPKPRLKPKPAPKQVWVCSWSPTFDDDWHNDVLCENGIASERPRLRQWDDFVEQWEIMESAREYARQRNAG